MVLIQIIISFENVKGNRLGKAIVPRSAQFLTWVRENMDNSAQFDRTYHICSLLRINKINSVETASHWFVFSAWTQTQGSCQWMVGWEKECTTLRWRCLTRCGIARLSAPSGSRYRRLGMSPSSTPALFDSRVRFQTVPLKLPHLI